MPTYLTSSISIMYRSYVKATVIHFVFLNGISYVYTVYKTCIGSETQVIPSKAQDNFMLYFLINVAIKNSVITLQWNGFYVGLSNFNLLYVTN